MKVLFITGRLHPSPLGGTGTMLVNLVNALSEDGAMDISVLGSLSNKESIDAIRCCFHKAVHFEGCVTPGKDDEIGDLLSMQYHYLRRISDLRKNYDIIHFNILPGLRSFLLLNFLRTNNNRCKFVLNIHDLPSYEIGQYTESTINKVGVWIHWSLALSQLSKFNEIVVNSTFMQDQVLNLGIPSSRLIIIPNGINIDDYVKFKHSNKNSDRIVCPNKVFYPKKGQDLLIRAFAESNCRKVSKLYLIGQGETKFKKYCLELVREFKLEGRVTFVDFLSKRELMNVIRNSSFCVFPSLYEGFGITILEAMACGKPIISTCFGGPNDFIIDGKNGLLVNPRDIKSMSVALDSLAISLVKRSEIGRQASLTAREFSWKTISQKYISVYNRVLDTT